MSVFPEDLEMQDVQELFNIPDSPRAESPTEISDPLSVTPQSSGTPQISSTTDSSPIIVSRIFTYADYEGLPSSPSPIHSTALVDISKSRSPTPLFDIPESRPPTPIHDPHTLFDIPESRPPTPIYDPHALFDIPPTRPSTPMLVDYETSSCNTSMLITAAHHSNPSAFHAADQAPPRPTTPPINGRNLIPFLPIITGRAALIRGALLERKSEKLYLQSKIDSVLQDMAELERQLHTMDAWRVIRAAERQQRSS